MSTFNHNDLMRDINASLAPFRKTQGNAMTGFGQLAKAAITDGALSAKHKELIALSIAVTQRWAARAPNSKKCCPSAYTWVVDRP